MQISSLIGIVLIVLIVMLVIWFVVLRSAQRAHLPRTPEGEKPQWMSTTPPPETIAVTEAEGREMALYDHKQGENEAAPFAEQIEDILHFQLSKDPSLSSYDVDLGTGPDGGLQIRVGDKNYTAIDEIPDERLRAAIKQAVATYNQGDSK